MARYMILDGNTVINIAEAEADFAASQGWIQDDQAGIGWSYDGETFFPPTVLDVASTIAAINAKLAALIAAGCAINHEGEMLHIQMDDGSRANLTAMAATAIAAINGSIPWPEGVALGWITLENIRIPLPTPGAGLALANLAGGYYSAIVQHGRSLKDAAAAAENQAELDAIDIETGWPESPAELAPITATPVLIAQARLLIDGLAISGFGTDSGIASVTAIDAGVAYLEFSSPVALPYLVWTSDGSGHRVFSAPLEQADYGFLIRSETAGGDPEFPAQIQLLITKA